MKYKLEIVLPYEGKKLQYLEGRKILKIGCKKTKNKLKSIHILDKTLKNIDQIVYNVESNMTSNEYLQKYIFYIQKNVTFAALFTDLRDLYHW
ncbi:MAG: hypothetical protein IPN86_14575 [Saprospiraceae bacterium]|nr:hypothetical protein [Saprospiraceae bacterium]